MPAVERINENNIVVIEYTEQDTITHEPAIYTSMGTYPIFYLSSIDMVLCPCCAHERNEPMNRHINYEIEDLYCDECNEEIEKAY